MTTAGRVAISMKGRRILLADDDDLAHAAMVRAATEFGCEIISILEGVNVASTALAERPDLIILDLTFPDADGRQILKHLKADSRTSRTPVVIWSGYDPGANRAVFLALGAEDYVEKSDPFTLLAKLRRVLFRESMPRLARAGSSSDHPSAANNER
jgi:DNA-binding response OmpR family regulator